MRDNRQSEVLQIKLLMETSIFYIIFVKTPEKLAFSSNLYHMEAHNVPNMEPKNLSPTARKIIEACDVGFQASGPDGKRSTFPGGQVSQKGLEALVVEIFDLEV